MNTLTTFTYGSTVVRTAGSSEEPLFCLKDICTVLGIKRTGDVSRALPEKFKGVVPIDTRGGTQNMVCVTEPGLYKVLIRTRKSKIAEKFQDWLCEDVIPEIRKTGRYENKELMRQIAILKDTTKTQQNMIQALSKEARRYNCRQVLETDRACHNAVSPLIANNIFKKFALDNGWVMSDTYTNAQRLQLVSELRKRIVHDCSTGRVVLAR